ncbi:hypothetical protein ACFO0H_14385, partial [Haloarchaeobius iranensis]
MEEVGVAVGHVKFDRDGATYLHPCFRCSAIPLYYITPLAFGYVYDSFDDNSISYGEGVIELFSHRDDRASRIVSAFVVGNCDDEAKAQGK